MNVFLHMCFVVMLVFGTSHCSETKERDAQNVSWMFLENQEYLKSVNILWESALEGDWDRFEKILFKNPSLVDVKTEKGMSLLHLLAVLGSFRGFRAILSSGRYYNDSMRLHETFDMEMNIDVARKNKERSRSQSLTTSKYELRFEGMDVVALLLLFGNYELFSILATVPSLDMQRTKVVVKGNNKLLSSWNIEHLVYLCGDQYTENLILDLLFWKSDGLSERVL